MIKGSEKLFKKMYGVAAPAGFGKMLWAHYEAPKKAIMGDGKGAVDAAMQGVSAIAAGVFVGSFAGPVGSVAGAIAGYVIAKGPGAIIEAFDTN